MQTPGGIERTEAAKATRGKLLSRQQGLRMNTDLMYPSRLANEHVRSFLDFVVQTQLTYGLFKCGGHLQLE